MEAEGAQVEGSTVIVAAEPVAEIVVRIAAVGSPRVDKVAVAVVARE